MRGFCRLSSRLIFAAALAALAAKSPSALYAQQSNAVQSAVEKPRSLMCAEHVRQLGGASPLPNLMEVKG
jgi:hypothetical protein